MARPAGSKQFQCIMRAAMRNDLDAAAIALREEGTYLEDLDRGRMARALFRWFLDLSLDERRAVVRAGWNADDDMDQRRRPSPSVEAGGDDPGVGIDVPLVPVGGKASKPKPDRKRSRVAD